MRFGIGQKALLGLSTFILSSGLLLLDLVFITSGDSETSLPGRVPDGGVVTTARLVYECVIDGNEDICAIPAAGGLPARLTDHPAQDGCPRWTPDGRRVIFNSNRSGEWQLWSMDADGRSQRRARSSEDRDRQSDPAPDGSAVVFLSNRGGFEGIWIHAFTSGKARQLIHFRQHTVIGNPDWSPRGDEIVFSSNHSFGHQIYRINAETVAVERVSPVTNGGCEPRFSPDGKKVVYVTRRHFKTTSQIIEHDLETGRERALLHWPALNYDPVYSPDASELAFASSIAGKEFSIYRQRLSDGRSWRVTFGPGSSRHPDYAPAR
ncbi:MAG: PD40 domain-containing protein [Vicinamibacteria bacterium]|nr:PD40 domain-containing protein [Vicinamibacteria bacterium]